MKNKMKSERKGRKFIENLNKKLDLICEGRNHQWEDLFDDMEQCKRCGVIRNKIKQT